MKVVVDFDVPVVMRDGVVLRADVYRPDSLGPWPTLVTRLPYGKHDRLAGRRLDPVQTARRGFIVAVQDTRGRFASDGEWEPFRFERQDGYDTVEWAARLPGANGRVGMYGDSYFANTQWLAALDKPPSLHAIAPAFTWSEPLDGLLARGGALEMGLAIPWSLVQGIDYLARRVTAADQVLTTLIDDVDRVGEDGYQRLPVSDRGVLAKHGLSGVSLARGFHDPAVAAAGRVAGHQTGLTVPTLNFAGWYDVFLQGSLDNYIAMSEQGQDARLVVGPWTHNVWSDPIGELAFGARASRFGIPAHPQGDARDLQLAWFGHHLAGEIAPELPSAPVRIFVMGLNEWRDEDTWPLARASVQTHYMRSDGTLTTSRPRPTESSTCFTYDPAYPVPTHGGSVVMAPSFIAGPLDQAKVEVREDVCTFTSEPLAADLEVTGRVRVILHAESSAPSTDWVARLCDVYPDGRSFNVCDGIIRVISASGQSGRHEIDLWSTSNVFLRGHRLRIQVTSSCFPRWDRNLNTGDQTNPRFEVAHQRLHHAIERPSYVELPTVPMLTS